jgi:GNAT superfamily N-acetyltransferase
LGVIPAVAADLAEVDAFLSAHVTCAMFPLTNLREYGLSGDQPYAQRLWLARHGAQVTDVLALSRSGLVLPVLPSAHYAAAADVLAGLSVTGIIGRQDWARGMQNACGLSGPFTLNRDEPHFELPLSALQMPQGAGQIVPLAQAPADTIKSWIHAYMIEALDTPKAQADVEVFTRYDRYVAANSHVVLMDGTQPLAMCGFNARLPQIVQVGGVYTPPALRGQGYARRAVGQYLAQARAAGVQRAVLFAASDTAASTYRALGFEQIGQWTLLLLAEPQVIHG